MRIRRLVTSTAGCLGLVLGCSSGSPTAGSTPEPVPSTLPTATLAVDVSINPRLLRRFQALRPSSFELTKNAPLVSLGQSLFFDSRLSASRDVACSSCHDLGRGGGDGRASAVGHAGQRGERNAPTVLNAAGAFAQFWDGRSETVEDQVRAPLLNPKEMAMPDDASVVARVTSIAGYHQLFGDAFPAEPHPVTVKNIGRAIGAFERELVTPGRWDDFLSGNSAALTVKEKIGLRTFLNAGCMVCHTGPLLGGTTFERAGVVEPWPNQTDVGRSAVTHSASDRLMFKVPTLRNVSKTAPYFHDGSAATLTEAVRIMAKHQLGVELSFAETDAIVTWLKALDGEPPPELVKAPELPR